MANPGTARPKSLHISEGIYNRLIPKASATFTSVGYLGKPDTVGDIHHIRPTRATVLLQTSIPNAKVQTRRQHTNCFHHLLVSHLCDCKLAHALVRFYSSK